MKKLAFGLMRLPQTDPNDWTAVDLEKTREMIDRYLAAGFTYFDTAYVYHGGSSEKAFGELVAARYPRDRFTITTKMPVFMTKSPADYERIFAQQLERCRVDYFDYYFLHAMGRRSTAEWRNRGALTSWFGKRRRERSGTSAFPSTMTPRRWKRCSPTTRRPRWCSFSSTISTGRTKASSPGNATRSAAATGYR